LAHATLETGKGAPSFDKLEVIWRDPIKGKGGQFGAAVAFSPDQKLLYLTVGERQRFTPAQDPNQPAGKILRLTLDGIPAPGNPMAGKTGANTVDVIDPPRNTEAAKTAPVLRTFTFTGPNLTPSGNGLRPIALQPRLRRRTESCGKSSMAPRGRTQPHQAGRTTAGLSLFTARTTTVCRSRARTRARI
jgi:hypothetical protein